MQAKWLASLSDPLPGTAQSAAAVQVGRQVATSAPSGLVQVYFELWRAVAHSLVALHPCHSHRPALQAKWPSSLSELPGTAQSAAAVQVGTQVAIGAPSGFRQATLVVLTAATHSAVDAHPCHSHRPAVQA